MIPSDSLSSGSLLQHRLPQPQGSAFNKSLLRGPGGRPEVSIILATLNEAANLPALLRGIEGSCTAPHEVIIVDDGSVDGTVEQIQSWASSHRDVLPILNRTSSGLLNAHLQGLSRAGGRYAIVMDSDLQHPPSLVGEIYDRLRTGYDLVVASRYAPGGSVGGRKPVRGVISRGATWITHLLLPQTKGLTDPLSGYFGMNLDSVKHNRDGHGGYKILLSILAANNGPRFCEIPYVFRERRNGGSKIVGKGAFVPVFLRELLSDRRLAISARDTRMGGPIPGSVIAPRQGALLELRR
jgi:dolichol-phosphate mannosyltransferase